MRRLTASLVAVLLAGVGMPALAGTISSPDGRIVVTLDQTDGAEEGLLDFPATFIARARDLRRARRRRPCVGPMRPGTDTARNA